MRLHDSASKLREDDWLLMSILALWQADFLKHVPSCVGPHDQGLHMPSKALSQGLDTIIESN